MSHIAYVNGSYVDHTSASTHIEDRGYQFADGVYEYMAFYNGKTLDEAPHLARLERSLKEIDIDPGHIPQILPMIIKEVIARNHRRDGGIYIQVSRSTARREHQFPASGTPNVVVTLWGSKMVDMATAKKGAKIITHPDNRWDRCDIKSISLLANILAKQKAISSGAKEAWLFQEDGTVTEGCASNAYLVQDGTIHTHPKGAGILGGIVRDKVLELAKEIGISVVEKPFNIRHFAVADEAFFTSTSVNVQPAIQIDDQALSGGKVGPVTLKLMKAYGEYLFKQTGKKW